MTINPLAKQLIHDLRHDAHTREHFSIADWTGKGTCNTVGCIAGTAIMCHGMLHDPAQSRETNLLNKGWRMLPGAYTEAGMTVLGLPNKSVASQLFVPEMFWTRPLVVWGVKSTIITDLGDNARPDLSTVNKMIEFAREVDRNHLTNKYNPNHCANALEDVLLHERLYVDWAEAYREDALV